MYLTEVFHLVPPHRHQRLRVQHDVVPAGPVIRLVHGPLVHVVIHPTEVPGVLASDDHRPVATTAHPSHGPTLGNCYTNVEGLGVTIVTCRRCYHVDLV